MPWPTNPHLDRPSHAPPGTAFAFLARPIALTAGVATAMTGPDLDSAIRSAAFQWLAQTTAMHGDVLPRTLLEQGFEYQGERITLIGPQGIWKPRQLALPLTITTTAGGPYHDSFGPDGLQASPLARSVDR